MLEILLSLLILVVVLGIVFWLLGIVLAGVPGAPAWLKGAIMSVVALICLIWLFGYGPAWHFRPLR